MKIVKKYGRNDDYNFKTDKKLDCIKTGDYSDQKNLDRNKIILAINSFTTIWLLTLPEKFQEWFDQCKTLFNAINKAGTLGYFTGIPSFPHLTGLNTKNCLIGWPDPNKYEFLPMTWSLM